MAVRKLVPHPTDLAAFLVPLPRGYFAVISTVDAAEVGRFNWSAITKDGDGVPRYAHRRRVVDGKLTHQTLHGLISELMGMPGGTTPDHRDLNGLDCRRSNLRPSDRAQSAQNRGIRRDSGTGIKGVWRHGNRWIGAVMANGKRYRQGFDSIEEATTFVVATRRALHGEFARN